MIKRAFQIEIVGDRLAVTPWIVVRGYEHFKWTASYIDGKIFAHDDLLGAAQFMIDGFSLPPISYESYTAVAESFSDSAISKEFGFKSGSDVLKKIKGIIELYTNVDDLSCSPVTIELAYLKKISRNRLGMSVEKLDDINWPPDDINAFIKIVEQALIIAETNFKNKYPS